MDNSASARRIRLTDLMAMDRRQLHTTLHHGHPLDLEALADTQYLGVDLSLPPILTRLLWQTFRKTFMRDAHSGVLRGWNVKMRQNGIDGPAVPLTDRSGVARTFGHYHVRPVNGLRFPRGWSGRDYLDYGCAGNYRTDVARFLAAPLVAVNSGCSDLLLGWEIGHIGDRFIPLPIYFALRLQGPLTEKLSVPRP